MTVTPRVLVVSPNAQQRELLHDWLVTAGYDVELTVDFPAARRHLDLVIPNVLISDVKLEAYNGLHLAIWSRGRQPSTGVVLIGDPDLVLQKEAEREQAAYLMPPLDPQVLLATVAAKVGTPRPRRRSARKPVALDAVIDGVPASVIDVSHEGLCLALRTPEAVALPAYFTLRLPAFDLTCRLQRVWTGRSSTLPGLVLCGAKLPVFDGASSSAWRAFVDAVPSRLSVSAESAG